MGLALLASLLPGVGPSGAVPPAGAEEPGNDPAQATLNTEAPVTPPPVGAPEATPTTEVVALRTATSKTFATAEPGRYVSRFYAAPVHFRDAVGAWRDIDMTLAPSPPDGRLRTRANSVAVELAPLADDPQLARVDFDAEHSVAFRLQGAAAAPVGVSGTLASYAAVLPDVAVELRAFWGGVKEDLVLTSRAAPDTYLFPLTLRGLTADLEGDTGDVVYRNTAGEVVGRTPHGSMQDSTPTRPEPGGADPPAGVPSHSEGVAYELVPHEGGTALRVTLDRAWLDSADRQFPVRVDPTTTFGANTDDTYVATNDTTRNDTYGDLNSGTETCCTNTIRYRSFVHFDTGWLWGRAKGISYARIATYLWGGWSCAARPTSMYRVTQGWWGGSMATYPGAAVGEEIHRLDVNPCPNQWIQWGDLQGVVHNWAVSRVWDDHGIMLKAYDENDNSQWRRFYSANQPGASPHLVVDWWGTPNTPDSLSPGDAVYDTVPTLSARYTHSDESTPGQLDFRLLDAGGGALYESYQPAVCHGCTATHVPSSLADGRYQWDVIGYDGARWGPWSGRTWFTLDRRPDVPDQLAPADGAAGTAPPTLSARYAHPDPGNSSGQVVFRLYDAADTLLSETYSASVAKGATAGFTPAALADGLYRWEALAYDGGGASNPNAFSSASARRTFRVDTTAPAAPSLSSSSHPDGSVWYPTRALSASWTAPSDPTGVGGYAVAVDQAATTTPAATVTQTGTTHSTTVGSDGQWYLHVRAVDGVGNWGPAAHYGFRADAAVPGAPAVSSSTHPDEAAWHADTDPTFAWSGGDTASGLGGWSFALDQTSDTTPDTASEGTFASRSYTALADGAHWFHVRRLNNAGSWGPAGHRLVQVDGTPPEIGSLSSSTHPDPDAWYADAAPSASWSATDTAPVDGYSWVLDRSPSTTPDTVSEGVGASGSWSALADGEWWLHVRARNATGTWGPAAHLRFRVDAEVAAPTVSSSTHPDPDAWYADDDVALAWSAVAESGIAGWSWTFDGADPDTTSEGTATTKSYTGLADGVHTFRVRLLDGLGRWSGTTAFTVRVDMTSGAPTVTSSTHPAQTGWYADDAPSLSWSGGWPSGAIGWSYTLDQSPSTTPDSVSEGTATTKGYTGLADGVHWFHVRAQTGALTWSETAHFRVQVDDTAPAAPTVSSSTHPSETAWSAQPDATLTFSVSDTAPVDGYSWVLDQSSSTTPDTTSEGAGTTATVTPGDGVYWFHVRARNSAGLWGAVRHRKLMTDAATGSATLSSSSHPDQAAWYADRHAVLGWATSEESGIAGYSTGVTPDAPGNPGTAVTTTATTAAVDLAEDRVWYLNVRARSNTGVWGPIASYRLQADTSPPSAPTGYSTSHPDPTAWYSNDDPMFVFAASDALSGIAGWSYVLDGQPTTWPDTTSEGSAPSATFADVADGVRWFHVRARDGAGNWGSTTHVQVRVDDTAPTALSATDSPDPVNVGNPVTFRVEWTDDPDGSPVHAVVCRTNAVSSGSCPGGIWATGGTGADSPATAVSGAMVDPQGNYDYWAFACDAADNCSGTQSGSFRVNDYPALTSTSVNPQEVESGQVLEFKATWSDSGDSLRAIVCRSEVFSEDACADAYWANGVPSGAGQSTATKSANDNDLGTKMYWLWVCDQNGLCSGPQSGNFTVHLSMDSSGYGAPAANADEQFSKSFGTQNWKDPCEDDHYRLADWRYGNASWDFKHNLLSYPANGYVRGTEGMGTAETKDLIRRAINAGPGGLNTRRTHPECEAKGKAATGLWTKFRDAGTYTENPAQFGDGPSGTGTNGVGWIDYTNPPPTTAKPCRDRMIDNEPLLAQLCPLIVSINGGPKTMREWGITFNVAARNPWTVNLNAPENEVIVQSVATHEALHAVGMEHTDHTARGQSNYCTRAELHAALTMYPCTPIRTTDGKFASGGRSNYWPYTLGYGDMLGLWTLRPQ